MEPKWSKMVPLGEHGVGGWAKGWPNGAKWSLKVPKWSPKGAQMENEHTIKSVSVASPNTPCTETLLKA